ncbi:MAG: thioesterase [Deltaproteobacteria bacterium]|nr:MAG: thioesterase [Deltaproteobacteria bacterium]
MLLYTARVAAIALRQRRMPRIAPLDSVALSFRAWPWHCDNNRHINNARYLLLMDYGRTAWVSRIGLVDAIVRERLHFVVGGSHLLFRRPVDLLEPFTLRTRLAGWDDRWFFVEQTFFRADGRVAVRGLVRGMGRNPSGHLAPEALFALTGQPVPPRPELPEEFARWVSTCDASIEVLRADDPG